MKSEVMLDLCFIREQQGDFDMAIQDELMTIFGNKLHWYLDAKAGEEIDIVVAEVRGMGPWASEDEIMYFIEGKASDHFFTWLQGYRIQVFPKEKGSACRACAKH